MFERSKSGQQNRAVFLDADLVCYVEGGGGTEDTAPDITFWDKVFSTLRPDIKVRCVPRGGKPILEKLARSIIEQDIGDTLVAMDTDFDEVLGHKIVDRRVLYTHGYSWENDVFSASNMELACCAVAHCGSLPAKVVKFLNDAMKSLRDGLVWPVLADFLALAAKSSVLPRQSPGRVIVVSPSNGLPRVDRVEVIKLCAAANRKTRPRTAVERIVPVDSIRHCPGHVLGMAAIGILRGAVRAHFKKIALTADHARDVALQTLSLLLATKKSDPAVAFHTAQCAMI